MQDASAPGPNSRWIESLSPWPEEFGLDRIRKLLHELGDPQTRYPAIHVVGSNGKSTTTRMIEALLLGEKLRVGSYFSPHVRSWSERIVVNGAEADFEAAVGAVRDAAERAGATQFEVLTAAALKAFADARVDVAVVEAGLGGRLDATNVLNTRVVVLTNVALEHTDVLGETREAIAGEKLAVVKSGAVVVLGEPEWEPLAREAGAAEVVVATAPGNAVVAQTAARAYLGRPLVIDLLPRVPSGSFGGHWGLDLELEERAQPPGRLEWRHGSPSELWDGAHNAAGVDYLVSRAGNGGFVVCASILGDKDVDGMLRGLRRMGSRLVATTSSNARALAAEELAERARPYYEHVEIEPDPHAALARARALAGPDGAVLVTGSLYLLADLHSVP